MYYVLIYLNCEPLLRLSQQFWDAVSQHQSWTRLHTFPCIHHTEQLEDHTAPGPAVFSSSSLQPPAMGFLTSAPSAHVACPNCSRQGTARLESPPPSRKSLAASLESLRWVSWRGFAARCCVCFKKKRLKLLNCPLLKVFNNTKVQLKKEEKWINKAKEQMESSDVKQTWVMAVTDGWGEEGESRQR